MSRSLNKLCLIGHTGGAAEARTTGNGAKVASFSLATSTTWTGDNGERQEKTEWHRVMVWNRGNSKLADFAEQYIGKGQKLYVEGPLKYREWEDKDGVKRTAAELDAREIILLDGKSGEPRESKPAGAQAAARSAEKAKAPAAASDFPALDDEEDDLPF